MTWYGNTATAWQRKIDCELCTAGKIRTRIHDNQYKCISETQAYYRVIEPYPDYVCSQFDGRWSCTCYKDDCEYWWDIVKNPHTGCWAHWTCGDTQYSQQTSETEWWYAGQSIPVTTQPYSNIGFSYEYSYTARRVLGCQNCPNSWHRTYLPWVANGQWVCVPRMQQEPPPNWPYSSCGSVINKYGHTLQRSDEDYDGQVSAGGYCGFYHIINNRKGYSHPSRLGQMCVCCEGQYKVSWKLTGLKQSWPMFESFELSDLANTYYYCEWCPAGKFRRTAESLDLLRRIEFFARDLIVDNPDLSLIHI